MLSIRSKVRRFDSSWRAEDLRVIRVKRSHLLKRLSKKGASIALLIKKEAGLSSGLLQNVAAPLPD